MKTQIISYVALALLLVGAAYAATTAATTQTENERMLVQMQDIMHDTHEMIEKCEKMMESGMMGGNMTGMTSEMAAMHQMHHG